MNSNMEEVAMETDVTNRVYLILRWFEHPKDPDSYGLGGGVSEPTATNNERYFS